MKKLNKEEKKGRKKGYTEKLGKTPGKIIRNNKKRERRKEENILCCATFRTVRGKSGVTKLFYVTFYF